MTSMRCENAMPPASRTSSLCCSSRASRRYKPTAWRTGCGATTERCFLSTSNSQNDYDIQSLLFCSGFQALQAYRLAHWLWTHNRRVGTMFRLRGQARHIESTALVSDRCLPPRP